MDKRSQLRCLGDCKDLLSKGASVLFFPEGTRSKDGKMAEFKKVCQACILLLSFMLLGDSRGSHCVRCLCTAIRTVFSGNLCCFRICMLR